MAGHKGTWDVLQEAAGMILSVEPFAKGVARQTVQRLMGFWLMWHLYGCEGDNVQPLIDRGVMAKSTAYRQKVEFYAVFGETVDAFLPDLAVVVRQFGAKSPVEP